MRSKLKAWIAEYAMVSLRISIGIIYVWFGALKFFPQLSPAEQLAKDTIHAITFGLIPGEISIVLLALWETVLGTLIIAGIWHRPVFYVLLIHLTCTFIPLFCFTDLSFTQVPYGFTLAGQYIVKNIVFICAAIVWHLSCYPPQRQ